MKKKYFYLIVAVGLLLFSLGCSKENNQNKNSQVTGASEQIVLFPHSKVWKSEHIAYMAGAKTSGGEDKCIQCHQNKLGAPKEVNCTTKCHKVETQVSEPAPTPLPVSNKCAVCHKNEDDDIYNNAYSHYPTKAELCTTCHTVTQKHLDGLDKKAETKSASADCYRCHAKKDTGTTVHPAMNDEGGYGCLSCHNPHGSSQRFFIRMESTKAMCTMCHDAPTASDDPDKHPVSVLDAKVKHGAVESGKSCVNCHNPHSSNNKKLLRLPSKELCLSCHDKTIPATLSDARTIPNIKAKLEQASQHSGAMGNCTDCHNPHGSQYNRLAIASYSISNNNAYPGTGANPYGLCLNCHDVDGMLAEKDFTTGFTNGTKNYHWTHVVDASGAQDKNQGRSCRVCHDPHGSSQDFHINESWNMNGNLIGIKYTKTANGGGCVTCHELKTYTRP